MYKVRPTDARKKADFEKVQNCVAKNKGADYDIKMNPFEVGTLRHDRFERHYRRSVVRYRDMEVVFKDLEEVYGFIGTRKYP